MHQVRRTAAGAARPIAQPLAQSRQRQRAATSAAPGPRAERRHKNAVGNSLQRQAWQWAEANRAPDGSLPSGKVIAARYGRHEPWGRLVKSAGAAGDFLDIALPQCPTR